MYTQSIKRILRLLIAAGLVIGLAGNAYGETYPALKGLDFIKAVVDFRNPSAKVAAIHLDLLHKTYKDKNLTAVDAAPDFVVVFMGPAVKLISTSREGVSAEDAKNLDAIAQTLSAMTRDGIRLEVCIAAVELLGVDPATLLPEIHKVPNGWISSIGYQHNGYALIPDF
jgi:intracellular sulfur oxidation DsrE/DsrF family protein